ncbi:vang-like protein 1 isoform X2 [Anopheles nili]|uniref:vang-like protein 1 isoform X2 n=1 Tax=Anopheles nili TaxID=185578 RepID=UPI00237BEAA6|nr:vang-like protein 1 isoform X2 [Anopheles nili]
METESVKSEPGSKSRRSRTSGGHHHQQLQQQQHSTLGGSHRTRHSHRNSNNHSRGGPNKRPDMAPFQTSVNLGEDGRDGQEIIEVSILPQDETWGDNTTAITGNTSEQSISMEDVSYFQMSDDRGVGFACQRYLERGLAVLLCVVAFAGPLAMVILPKLGFFPSAFESLDLTPNERVRLLACNAECKGMLVSLAARLLLLAIGLWALFLRKPAAIMPRIFLFRSCALLLVLIASFAYWLFYIVQVTEGARAIVAGSDVVDYRTLVAYATSYCDTLLFVHYVAVVLLEIRHLQPLYHVKVIRSPDGESHSYSIGQLSIQRAAVWVLQRYYTEFSIYNPYLERLPVSKAQRKAAAVSSFKYYDVDGATPAQQQSQSRAVLAAHARRRDSSHNERFYEEHEYERRVKKRRARLVTAAEEAFTHIKRMHDAGAAPPAIPLDPQEAAQAIFPSMARALQKYLRVTRQQPRHTVESILKHLAHCLKHDMTPRAFLEPYLVEAPVLQNDKERRPNHNWSLICDELLSRPLSDGCTFQLIQNDVSLTVSIHRIPHFTVSEEVVDPKSNKFVLKLNSETSV